MKRYGLTLCLLLALPFAVPTYAAVTAETPTLSWKQVQDRPLPRPGLRSAYGPAPQQFGELRLPPGDGPFPVAVLVHGGCWLNAFDYRYFTHLAQSITAMGIATWTLEYRRLGDDGGGWPGTLLDVADATDHLRTLQQEHALDLSRVVSVGHSAGGQLALWLAARARLPAQSALHRAHPLRLRGAIGLAPITDLQQYRVGPADSCNASVDRLLGGDERTQPQRYAQASPRALLPLGVPQWLIQGGRDPIVPAKGVQDYLAEARRRGDTVELLLQPAVGHFEPAVPDTASWPDLQRALRQALKITGDSP